MLPGPKGVPWFFVCLLIYLYPLNTSCKLKQRRVLTFHFSILWPFLHFHSHRCNSIFNYYWFQLLFLWIWVNEQKKRTFSFHFCNSFQICLNLPLKKGYCYTERVIIKHQLFSSPWLTYCDKFSARLVWFCPRRVVSLLEGSDNTCSSWPWSSVNDGNLE